MENPATWDTLTACLAACSLDTDPEEAWEFLKHKRLIQKHRSTREDYAVFIDLLASTEKEVTGPSFSARVASQMVDAGLIHAKRNRKDPNGYRAKRALHEYQITYRR